MRSRPLPHAADVDCRHQMLLVAAVALELLRQLVMLTCQLPHEGARGASGRCIESWSGIACCACLSFVFRRVRGLLVAGMAIAMSEQSTPALIPC
jgi:hypothetical protein